MDQCFRENPPGSVNGSLATDPQRSCWREPVKGRHFLAIGSRSAGAQSEFLFVVEQKQRDQGFGFHRERADAEVVKPFLSLLRDGRLDLEQRSPGGTGE